MADQSQITVEEGNRLIVEFMGGKFYKDSPSILEDHIVSPSGNAIKCIDKIKYHSSFDWIMPAWIKFRSGWDGKNAEYGEWLYSLGWYLYSAENPRTFFERLVYAIKWYNSHKSKQ